MSLFTSSWLTAIALKYETKKIAFATWANISDRELHTHLGLLVFALVIVVLRRPMRSPWPWLATMVVEGGNEYFDRLAYGSWRWPDTRVDIVFTLFWPTFLFIAARIGMIKLR